MPYANVHINTYLLSIFSFVNKSTIYTYIHFLMHAFLGSIPLAQVYALDMREPSTFTFRTACSKLARTVSDNESYLYYHKRPFS